jgi:hypothetical protein
MALRDGILYMNQNQSFHGKIIFWDMYYAMAGSSDLSDSLES